MNYLQKKKEIEDKFNQRIEEFKKFQEQATILQQAINENATERNRLQGEFRLLEQMQKEETEGEIREKITKAEKNKKPELKPPKKKK